MNWTLCILLALPFLTNGHYFSNTPITNSSGIIYNKLGIAKTSNTQLALLTHINITYLDEARLILETIYLKSKNLCTFKMKDEEGYNYTNYNCEQTLNVINDELKNINSKHEILHQLAGQGIDKRKRRGLVNAVSHAFKFLFGVPDANDAQYYTDSINMLLNNNRQTQTLLKSQIQIISGTIKNFNQSLAALKNNEDIMNSNINRINKFMTDTKLYITELEARSIIQQQISTLLSLSHTITQEYNKYIEAVNLGRHNILSPLIVTPEILLNELTSYKGEHELVVSPKLETLPIFYKILDLQVIPSKDFIIFALKYPLVKKTIYELYHLIPLPVQFQNTSFFSYISPKQPYLMITQPKTHFSLLQDLRNCIMYLEGNYVCMDVHTTKAIEQPTCEAQLLSRRTSKIPEDCDTKTIRASIETWTYIQNNQWIYVLQKPTTVTIVCQGDGYHMEDIVLHQTGILHLESQCKGYSSIYLLEPTKQTIRNISHYVPSISIVDSDCCMVDLNKVKIDATHLEPVKLTNIDLSDFKYATDKLNEFDQILTHSLNEPFIVTHTQWYTITLGIVVAVLIIIICINCCRWCGCLGLLQRFFCFTRYPNEGEAVSPMMKNRY
ncbi:uncharacterized protein LOC122396899 [Colletes gigas]|uniref:uncharacterized protein LOC122396899 n=1 Tax=Colletes gigas TaxID=935657 RepID=UPI001C9B3448|nr:uncharacterized protein LOC122396899 [Colletes gigas]